MLEVSIITSGLALLFGLNHCSDIIMSTMASQITSILTVCLAVCSDPDQRTHQSSTSLVFVRGIHWWPVNSPHKGPVMWKKLPFDDVIICIQLVSSSTIPGDPITCQCQIISGQFLGYNYVWKLSPNNWFFCHFLNTLRTSDTCMCQWNISPIFNPIIKNIWKFWLDQSLKVYVDAV